MKIKSVEECWDLFKNCLMKIKNDPSFDLSEEDKTLSKFFESKKKKTPKKKKKVTKDKSSKNPKKTLLKETKFLIHFNEHFSELEKENLDNVLFVGEKNLCRRNLSGDEFPSAFFNKLVEGLKVFIDMWMTDEKKRISKERKIKTIKCKRLLKIVVLLIKFPEVRTTRNRPNIGSVLQKCKTKISLKTLREMREKNELFPEVIDQIITQHSKSKKECQYSNILPLENDKVIKLGADGIRKTIGMFIGICKKELLNAHLKRGGFLGEEDDIGDVILNDVTLLSKNGISRVVLANKLKEVTEMAVKKYQNQRGGRKKKKGGKGKKKGGKKKKSDWTTSMKQTRGFHDVPFHYSFAKMIGHYVIGGTRDIEITNKKTKEKINYGDMLVWMVKSACFFEGNVGIYRLDPLQTCRVLNLITKKESETMIEQQEVNKIDKMESK